MGHQIKYSTDGTRRGVEVSTKSNREAVTESIADDSSSNSGENGHADNDDWWKIKRNSFLRTNDREDR